MFLSAAKWNMVRLRMLNWPICCLQIKYVKSFWIRTVTRRNVTHLAWRMKKWSHAHHCQLLPVQTPSSSEYSANTSEDENAVQHSHNPCNGYSPHGPKCMCCTPLLGSPKGRAMDQHTTGDSRPLSVLLLLFFSEIITLLVVEKNWYNQEYLHFLM